jgi:hypothetical protein
MYDGKLDTLARNLAPFSGHRNLQMPDNAEYRSYWFKKQSRQSIPPQTGKAYRQGQNMVYKRLK